MYETNYHRASSIDDAVALFDKSEGSQVPGGRTDPASGNEATPRRAV